MSLRGLAAVAVASLVLGGCTGDAAGPTTPAAGRCHGVAASAVRGPHPAYADRPLAEVPGGTAACAAYWLPGADRRLVPQGLALDHATDVGTDDGTSPGTVWVSGYRFDFTAGARRCVLTEVSRRTGRRVTGMTRIVGAVGSRTPKYCRHGGGLELTDDGLWISETTRLWLLDPGLVGTGRDPVLRVWGITAPLRGSTLVEAPGRVGLGQFVAGGPGGDVIWFDVDRLLRPGVLDLVGSASAAGSDPGRLAPDGRTRGLPRLQGGTLGPRGLLLTQSTTHCGVLRLPRGRRVGIAPGTEDVELDGRGGLWAVSEAGAKPYQERGGRPLVPMLVRYDADRLFEGPAPGCEP